jgi:nickel/cobalt exporter
MSPRAWWAAVVAAAASLGVPAAAGAHPLGNFSVNHLTVVSVSADRVDVRYLLDQAEIPTFQERGLPPATILARKRAEVERRVLVRVDGRRVTLRPAGRPALSRPMGQGGLRTTRLELPLFAAVSSPRRVAVRDGTFPGRLGWRSVLARPGRGTAVRSSAPAADPTHGLRRYPVDLLASPADLRSARFAVRPGAGTLAAADAARATGSAGAGRSGGGLERLFDQAAAGKGVLVLLLLAAFGWGAVHALSPGHGKAMVAAYLVGTRGTARHAALLGATVTVTHTAGVVLLGVVALALSHYVLPEDLYPWLNLVSGLLVVGVGGAVLRSRLRRRGHTDDHPHHAHARAHAHPHEPPDRLGARGLVAMGASAGLIPCPTALVVLLGAVAQHQIALGLVLIVAFSAGLAATLTALGLAVVSASGALARLPAPPRAAAALPTASALVIVAVGLLLTAQAVPQLG